MPTETTFRIDFHIEQTGLDVHGEASISPNPPTLNADITQEGLSLSGGQYIYPSMDDFITFGRWFKGDKGDNGTARTGTTAFWNAQTGFVPEDGEIIVYTDKSTKIVDGVTVYIPGVKIGSGNAYVQDLAFVADDIADSLLSHINDLVAHVTQADRNKWNNKLNVSDVAEVVGETLTFNRN